MLKRKGWKGQGREEGKIAKKNDRDLSGGRSLIGTPELLFRTPYPLAEKVPVRK